VYVVHVDGHGLVFNSGAKLVELMEVAFVVEVGAEVKPENNWNWARSTVLGAYYLQRFTESYFLF
jgi:hypothetical protein